MNWIYGIIGVGVGYYIVVRAVFSEAIETALQRDPAALNSLTIIFTYSGFHALVLYRIAHFLKKEWNIPFFPRFISQFAKFVTGIEIHPGASIGKGFFIDHGMGVVIGETTIIGDNVTLFQGVTLGGTGKERGKRHPTLKNDIVVGAGAKVLGNITIGNNVSIGANAVVLRDVPSNSTVVGVPGRVAKKSGRRIPGGINLDYTSLPDPMQKQLEKLQHEIDHIEHEIEDYHSRKDKEDE
ncbi:MAG: serine O-acetyltransferase [Candidatus Omnitrophota bacterium]|nr:serine O-acetyltransferase [Candidatus Omnitrophota bacterium]